MYDMEYKKRIADQILADKLESAGAVLVEGPKYCGKTTLSKQQAKSVLSMADPDTLSQNLALARTNISRLLVGDTPRLIDEWQIAPQFWDAVRNEADRREDDGQFILTGSAVPPKPKKDEEGNDIVLECNRFSKLECGATNVCQKMPAGSNLQCSESCDTDQGLYCDSSSHTCQWPKSAGVPCTQNEQCISMYCAVVSGTDGEEVKVCQDPQCLPAYYED